MRLVAFLTASLIAVSLNGLITKSAGLYSEALKKYPGKAVAKII